MICLGVGFCPPTPTPFILFAVLGNSWICSLVSDLNLGEITSHSFSSIFSILFFLHLVHSLSVCHTSLNCPHSHWILSSVIFSPFFSLLFCFGGFYWSAFKLSLSPAVSCLLVNPTLVAQWVKNLSAMWETWVWSLGWEDPLEKGMVTHSSILVWRISWPV